ncbi:MAG: glycosyltransferase family 2 protein [Proteobacteria bacterium]|nr:glycosyltransferase family 2 protein [Pseudomonadota bacterium]MCP4917875.1 glycosyltransferase family 2 protein [Pseudomonadota bacterium]
MSRRISVVVPVYDEEGNLEPLHEAITSALEGLTFEVLYVDDGSVDSTPIELAQLAERDDRVRLIRFVRNYGQTAALTAGIRHASNPIIITLDADLQNDPADIPTMLEKLDEGYDVVCGWRKDRQDAKWTRNVPSAIANRLISELSNVHLHDYGCTLRVYKSEYLKHIPLYGEMHRFIPIYVTWAGAKLVEMPVRHHARVRGVSKYGLGRIPKVLLDLTTVKFLRDFYVTPIYFFGYAGFFFTLLGLITATWAVSAGVMGELDLAGILGVGAVLMMMLGLVEVTLGIVAEVLIRMHYDIRDKAPYRIHNVTNLDTREEVVARAQTASE